MIRPPYIVTNEVACHVHTCIHILGANIINASILILSVQEGVTHFKYSKLLYMMSNYFLDI